MTLKRHSFNHVRANIEECHDRTEKDGTSSNTPYNVHIEEKTRHK